MADGDPVVAAVPDDAVVVDNPQPKYTKRWTVPTNTWLAAQLSTLAGIVVNAIDTGWSHTESKAIVLWAIAGATAYLVPDKVKDQT